MRTLIVVLFIGFAAPGTVHAQAGISCSASISSSILAFGNIVPASPTPTSALLGEFAVRCNNTHQAGRNVTMRLTISAGSSGSDAQREMIRASAGSPLLYNLFQDAAYTTVWPATSSGSPDSLAVPGNGSAELRRPIFGRVPGSQSAVTPGLYADSLTATVTY